ncbi:MAG TPA: conjugal transfer protein TraF [Gammaproteobacteria bacterium]|nr:conjugal transfer protein TraF [Gammaproteobacteria bacterium]
MTRLFTSPSRARAAIAFSTTLLLFVASPAGAVPFGTFTPRAQAMGGAAVASAAPDDGAFANPALLATRRPDGHFSFGGPMITARVSGRRHFLHDLDRVQSDYARARRVVAACVAPYRCNGGARQAAVAALQRLQQSLVQINGDRVTGDATGAVTIGLPGNGFGGALFADSRLAGGGRADYSSRDRSHLESAIGSIRNSGSANLDPSMTLSSSGRFRGALISEAGIALAHRFGRILAAGIAPKVQRVETIDYTQRVDQASIDYRKGTASSHNLNVDAGIAARIDDTWRVGLVGRDLVAQDYPTVAGHTVRIRPSYRLGIARNGSWFTLAADYDLNTGNPVGGLGARTRFLSVGAELDLDDTLKLRLGVRDNRAAPAGTRATVASAGIGLRILDAHVDASVIGNGNELGAGLQAGVAF